MSKSKIFGILFILIVAVVGIGVWRVANNLPILLRSLIEDVGSEVTQTPVKVAAVDLDLRAGSAAISGLTIDNPRDFSDPQVFRLERIAVALDFASLTSDPVVINEIRIVQPEIFVELNKENQLNLDVLNKNIQQSTGGGESAQSGESSPAKSSSGKKIIIKILNFESGSINAKADNKPDQPLKIDFPIFTLNGLGESTNGATPEELAREITQRLITFVKKQTETRAKEWARDELEKKAKEKLSKELEGKAGKELGSKLSDKLEGLLKR